MFGVLAVCKNNQDCKKHQTKRGVTRQGYVPGTQRRLVNQHKVDVVIRYMMSGILKSKSEHISNDGLLCIEDLSTISLCRVLENTKA